MFSFLVTFQGRDGKVLNFIDTFYLPEKNSVTISLLYLGFQRKLEKDGVGTGRRLNQDGSETRPLLLRTTGDPGIETFVHRPNPKLRIVTIGNGSLDVRRDIWILDTGTPTQRTDQGPNTDLEQIRI